MPRSGSSAMLAAIAAQSLQPSLFVQLSFQNGDVYLWSGVGNSPTFNGQTWQGAGDLLSIEPIAESFTPDVARGVAVGISGFNSTSVANVMGQYQIGLPAAIYLGLSASGAFTFTVTSANATLGAVYSDSNGHQVTVLATISGGTTLLTQGNGLTPPPTSGTITLVSGTGDATITFSYWTTLIASPFTSFYGRMGQASVRIDGDKATITINLESRTIDMNNAVDRRLTTQDQQMTWPGDDGLMFVTSIQDITVFWGGFPNAGKNL